MDKNKLLGNRAAMRANLAKIKIATPSANATKNAIDMDPEELEQFNALRFGKMGDLEDYYERLEVLGEGCSSVVWKYKEKTTGTLKAIKTIRTTDPELLTIAKNEFELIRSINHPYIIEAQELFLDIQKGRIYTVMELVKAKEMWSFIMEDGPYEAAKIFKKVLEAIQWMHSQGVCHRDLKPQNILVDAKGDIIKIIDFNISKNVGVVEVKKMLTFTGTLSYCAPEMLAESAYGYVSSGMHSIRNASGRVTFSRRKQSEINATYKERKLYL